MICFMCKGAMRDGISTFTADLGDRLIIIKNIPSRICGQCGEVTYSDEVGRRLEQIVDSIKQAVVTEIAVVNYTDQAA
jgi:YgiT-type zinc finger domain-containing protein